MNQDARIYTAQFGAAMAAYAVVLIASIVVLQHVTLAVPWQVLIALAPVIPTLFALAAFLRFLGKMDELQRRIQVEALAIGAGTVGFLSFAYGFLENVGLPSLSYIWVLPALVVFWAFGLGIASWRYH
jgi:hypothetical protein